MKSTIFQDYQFIKILNKGSFTNLILAQRQHINFLIKIIQKKQMNQTKKDLKFDLHKQISSLLLIKSDFIVKLIKFVQDQINIYLVYQYCNGGSLMEYQNKKQNKVIQLQKSYQILSQLIKGLEQLHNYECLHRNISMEDIFVKIEDNSQKFLIGSFLNINHLENTKTCSKYFAPQLLNHGKLTEASDVWALGIIFYFMLNNQYPFNLTDLSKDPKIRTIQTIYPFSYEKIVKQSTKKLLVNNTAEIEDMFRRIFEQIPQKRIKFAEIKKYPSMRKYFRVKQRIFFESENCKFKSILQQLNNCFSRVSYQHEHDDEIKLIEYSKKFQKQIQQLKFHLHHKQFIYYLSDYFKNQDIYFHKSELKFLLRYSLLKMYIIEAKKLYKILSEKSLCDSIDLNLNLFQHRFFQSSEYKIILSGFHDQISRHQIEFKDTYKICQLHLYEIQKNFKDCANSIRQDIVQTNFEQFKKEFRCITNYAIKHVNQINSKHISDIKDAPRLTDLRIRIYISHLINEVFNKKELHQNFRYYFEWKNNHILVIKEDPLIFTFESFKIWLIREQKFYKTKTINFLFKKYFG